MIDTQKLKQAVVELNNVTNELNEKLSIIEKEIQEIAPGLVAWINKENDKYVKFGYYRFPDNWHLAVKVGDEPPKPILQSARYYRYQCYVLRQQIIDALSELSIASAERWKKSIENKEEIGIEEITDANT